MGAVRDLYYARRITGSGGGVSKPRKDVNFIDDEGNAVYAYTAAEFANLTAMPSAPNRKGLVATGWNWSLADAKAAAAAGLEVDVGALYTTVDGKTRVYVTLNSDTLSPYLGFCLNGSATIDWDDGDTDTVTGNDIDTIMFTQHVYDAAGEYVITIDVTGGLCIYGDSNGGRLLIKDQSAASAQNVGYLGCIQRVEIGSNVTVKGMAFNMCVNLRFVNLPEGMAKIWEQMFYACVLLQSIVVPSGVTELDVNAFSMCFSLLHVSLPKGLLTIGESSLRSCNFSEISIPNTVTSIGTHAFRNCYGLRETIVPDSVASIGATAFNSAFMSKITIGSGVTSISAQAFQACTGLCAIHFKGTTPPVVANSNAFTNLPTDCKIYVPAGTLATYKAATNYPDPSTYTYVEE